MNDLISSPVTETINKIKNRQIKATDVVDYFLKRIKKLEPKVDAFLTIFDDAVDEAKKIDEKIEKNLPIGRLAGIPIAIKDNICVKGKPTTCASKILYNYIPSYDATVVERLKSEDAIIVGKTNMDEFAMGSSTENSAFKLTRNPWDLERVSGGSSGGSACCVAMRMCMLSLGSDTGGSVRQPACFCGVLGLKPTYGMVSRYGLVAFASSLDQIGPFSIFTEDLALLLEVISGYDKNDATSINFPVPNYTQEYNKPISDLKFGILEEIFTEDMDKEAEKIILDTVEIISKLAKVKKISLPHIKYSVSTYYLIAPSEASSNLARYDGVKYGLRVAPEVSEGQLLAMYRTSRDVGFGPEVKRRIMLGTYALSAGYYDAYYLKAQKVRRLIKNDFDEAFKEVDVILTPVTPTPAFKIGGKISDPLTMYLSDIFTIPVNLAGVPGISIPCGFTSQNLPVAIQAISRPLEEVNLLKLAFFLEKQLDLVKYIPLCAQ